MSATPAAIASTDPRERLAAAVAALDHVLPGQAPILNFVHHNTLHGYQHLPFDEALDAAFRTTGVFGYLPERDFRALYAAGRISDADLDVAIADRPDLHADQVVASAGGRAIHRKALIDVALRYGVAPITPERLAWLVDVEQITERFQEDIPDAVRRRILDAAVSEGPAYGKSAVDAHRAAVADLWSACVATFDLLDVDLHPEDLVDLPVRLAESLLAEVRARTEEAPSAAAGGAARDQARRLASERAAALVADVGARFTLSGLVAALTGEDPRVAARTHLTRLVSAHLDEGLAPWGLPERGLGLYRAWRRLAPLDLTKHVQDLVSWDDAFRAMPVEPLDALHQALAELGVPADQEDRYLQRLALELPGWSGLVNWRHHRPTYRPNADAPTSLVDYLVLRLFLERAWLDRVCRDTWGIAGGWDDVTRYVADHPTEILVRHELYQGRLPEYLAARARDLVAQGPALARADWDALADMVWTWQLSPAAAAPERHTVYRSAWRLFRLAQHLGLSGGLVRQLSRADGEALFAALDSVGDGVRGSLWLAAYEHHYRDHLINALGANHGRGRWQTRTHRPQAQIVFCIDEREESIRRHLEERNPEIETLGAAGFFGVVMNWRGLDDHDVTPLCPVVATPAHEVREVPRSGAEAAMMQHVAGRHRWHSLVSGYHEGRRGVVATALGMLASAPAAAVATAALALTPTRYWRFLERVHASLVPGVPTEPAVTATEDGPPPTPQHNRLGFTDAEQADRVAGLLRNIGLQQGFAPLVVIMAHGSTSQNNPHEHAHDCGACSGRHGGPNARSYAAMANRPAVRRLLTARGIHVPDDTWFLGAQHNTCDEGITYFDADLVPQAGRAHLDRIAADLDHACRMSAHERCRRFGSAPGAPSPERALAHVAGRAYDFSQVRPEWGHATNASALVGRRSMSQGLFLDRRSFLISYDPTTDPEGTILEGILLAVGPVGAGINLEYYFSTVDRERFGCGTKVPHNVTGLFAVMEGAASDLRTGLPKQMTEVHEPVRLQIVVEASTRVLGEIYGRQASLRELIGNEWVHVIAKDPETGEFSFFRPARGFVRWTVPPRPLPTAPTSPDYYQGQTEPLAPALVGA